MIDTTFKQGDSEWMIVRKILERLNQISGGGSVSGPITSSGFTFGGPALLGRYDPGTGSLQALQIGSGLSLVGDTLQATGSGSGDVIGPVSATDQNITIFDGATGKLIEDSGYSIADVLNRANHTGTQSWATISGTPTTLAGYGITDAQPLDADLTAIAALTTTAFGRDFLTLADAAASRAYIGAGTGSGTVTSFSSGDLSPLFTTSVATATTTPALSFSLSTQNANLVFAGPTTGIAAAPTFRSLVAADIPDISSAYVPTSRTVSTTAPLAGGGDLSANRTFSIADAAADGATKGAAAFATNDFNSAAGVISIDYANGQAAGAGAKGFLTSADWTTFNGKQAAGNYITALTGDVTASGPGSVAATVTAINGVSLAGLATGILKNTTATGIPSIAVAGDFPTLNQNTTGSAATLTTPRAIYGNNFDGSANLAQVIASTYGGTSNGFTKFTGPATAEKTFTLPNASATILTTNAAVTVAQGGTGITTYAEGDLLFGNAGGSLSTLADPGLPGYMLVSDSGLPTWVLLASQAVTSLAGTANEITASASVGSVALSLPTALTFTGKTVTGGIFNGEAFNGTVGATTPSTVAATSVSVGGDLTFTGTARRILGDLSNATYSNRLIFQNSVLNGGSVLSLMPNGTSTVSSLVCLNSSDADNCARGRLAVTATDVSIVSDVNGSGTALPMRFDVGGNRRFAISLLGSNLVGTQSALATTATDGFIYIPTCAGTPTGVPTAVTGLAPLVVNTTNNKLYFYSGGAWRDAGP